MNLRVLYAMESENVHVRDRTTVRCARVNDAIPLTKKTTLPAVSGKAIYNTKSDWRKQKNNKNNCSRAFKILTSKPTGKRPPWTHRRRWEGNIRIYIKQTGMRNLTDSTQSRDLLESPYEWGMELTSFRSH